MESNLARAWEVTVKSEVWNGQDSGGAATLAGLPDAVVAWCGKGDRALLHRWFDRELDQEGVPVRLPLACWPACLAGLACARQARERGWPALFDARLEGFLIQTLRFCRPDVTVATGPRGTTLEVREALRFWSGRLEEPGLDAVLDGWLTGKRSRRVAVPEPNGSHAGRPLAALRSDWSRTGDLIAVDHRAAGSTTRFELIGLGRSWLGPTWTLGQSDASSSKARPTLWHSDGEADLAEWSFRSGTSRCVRTALLLRGRRLALLADQVEGNAAGCEVRLELPGGLEASRGSFETTLTLGAGSRRGSALLVPLGLGAEGMPGQAGSLVSEPGSVVLRSPAGPRRRWLPLLVSWDPARNRKRLAWRSLTITERWQVCSSEAAVAYRVAWGRDDSLVVYRSLARPAPRAFLGHQTSARFLVGLFNKDGELEPLVTIDE